MIEQRYFSHSEADRHTLADMVERYIDTENPNQKRRQVLGWWVSKIGTMSLSQITKATIVEQRDELRKGITRSGTPRTPATVNRYLAYLSSLYSTAVREWQWANQNPVLGIKKLPEAKGRVRYLQKDEIAHLIAECDKTGCEQITTFVILALSTGARAGELLDMRWPDVDLSRGIAVLHNTKNGDRRPISIKGKANAMLIEHQKARRMDSDSVFPGHDGISRFNYYAPWERALLATGIEDFRFHDLRHTCASYLAMNGASIPEIAAVLGHKSWAMTQRYSHLSDAHVSDVVERMNREVLE